MHCINILPLLPTNQPKLPALEVVISTTYGAASDEGARGWRPFRFSEPPYIIVTMARCVRGGSWWDQLNITVTSLCVSCHSHCYLFACYYYFMLRLFILCYLCRTIALVATVICWLYPTLNKFYLIFYLILSYRPQWVKTEKDNELPIPWRFSNQIGILDIQSIRGILRFGVIFSKSLIYGGYLRFPKSRGRQNFNWFPIFTEFRV